MKKEKKSDGKLKLTHFDAGGEARMVDVSAKMASVREAKASAFVEMSKSVLKELPRNKKGNALEVARVAGILAAKRTAELIPLCHPLALTHLDVLLTVEAKGVRIVASARTTAQTGVEMEAMTAAAVAALAVYDMTKGMDKGIVIREVRLEEKSGGKSGDYRRKPQA